MRLWPFGKSGTNQELVTRALNDILAARGPTVQDHPLLRAIDRGAETRFAVCYVAADGAILKDLRRDASLFFHRKDQVRLQGCVSGEFECKDKTDVRLTFDAVVRIEPSRLPELRRAPFWFASVAPEALGWPGTGADVGCITLDELKTHLVLRVPEDFRDYSFADLQTLKPEHVQNALAPFLAKFGMAFVSVSAVAASSAADARLQRAEEEKKRLAEITDRHCTEEKQRFRLEMQLETQQQELERMAAEHRVKLATVAQQYENNQQTYDQNSALNRQKYEAECAQIQTQLELSQTALQRAKEELKKAEDESRSVEEFRQRIPEILERTVGKAVQDFTNSVPALTVATDAYAKSLGSCMVAVNETDEATKRFLSAVSQTMPALAAVGREAELAKEDLCKYREDLCKYREELAHGAAPRLPTHDEILDRVVEVIVSTHGLGKRPMQVEQIRAELSEAMALPQGATGAQIDRVISQPQSPVASIPGVLAGLQIILEQNHPEHRELIRATVNRTGFQDWLNAKMRADREAERGAPALTLDVYDGPPGHERLITSIKPLNADGGYGFRGVGWVQDQFDPKYLYDVQIRSPRAGMLWLFNFGRFAQEKPYLLIPWVSELTGDENPPIPVAQGQTVSTKAKYKIYMRAFAAPDSSQRTNRRETFVALVTDFPDQHHLVSSKDGPGFLAVEGLESGAGNNAYPIWLDVGRLMAAAPETWSAGKIEFLVKE